MTAESALPVHTFGSHTLRTAGEVDRTTLDAMIAADPDHRGRVDSDFFLRHSPGEDGWAVVDAFGEVVFYLKTQVTCRAHIQFGEAETPEGRERNRDAMQEGMEWLERQLRQNGFHELVFSSTNPPLIASAIRRLGFRRSPNELVRAIPAQTPRRSPADSSHPEPQLTEMGVA